MKLYLAVVVLFVVIFKFSESAELPDNLYNKYENVDIDRILQNNRVLSNYIKCVMEEGPCTPEGRDLKKYLPDALQNGCTKCTDRQKGTAEKVIRHLMDKRKKDWDRLEKKYDPTGEYRKKYERTLPAGQ